MGSFCSGQPRGPRRRGSPIGPAPLAPLLVAGCAARGAGQGACARLGDILSASHSPGRGHGKATAPGIEQMSNEGMRAKQRWEVTQESTKAVDRAVQELKTPYFGPISGFPIHGYRNHFPRFAPFIPRFWQNLPRTAFLIPRLIILLSSFKSNRRERRRGKSRIHGL